MTYLLDTCTFLWFLLGDPRLSPQAGAIIADESNDIALSIVSFWEMAIKSSLGKLPLPVSLGEMARIAQDEDISLLPITVGITEQLQRLSFHHTDPFDRTIAATAIEGGRAIVTPDVAFNPYGVRRVW